MAARVLAIITDAWGAEGGIAQYNRDLLAALDACDRIGTIDVEAYTGVVSPRSSPHSKTRVRCAHERLAFAWNCVASAPGADIVFCGHLHLAPVARLAARRAGAKLWLQTHGIEAWDRPSRWRRRASGDAALVTAVSRYTRTRVCQWLSTDPRRVRVLPNTVDTGLFVPLPPAPRDAPVLLSIGRLSSRERYKGHDRIIGLISRLRERHRGLRYRIVGDGDDRERLESLAGANGVSEAVEFAGYVPREQLPEELRNATLFVMPSTGEGFGIAFVEALACGRPAVGLDSDGSRDALGDGDLGIVASADTLFECLDAALARPVDARNLATRTRQRFAPERFRAHVAMLVEELLGA